MESASRFAHLLQPIKDMSKIWNIPIAAELESYLDELEQLSQLDPEEGLAKMNFAEAALLVQGSANIFGRKVELLYELAYHALDLIVSDRKDDKGPKRKGAYSAGLWGPIPDELETIDHLIKEGRGLEIDDGAMPNRASAMRRVPLWLMPREATDRRRHEFRITSCAVHRTGCHLLQESDATELDKLLAENRVQRDGTEPLAPAPPQEVNELDEELQALLCMLPPDQRGGLEEDEQIVAKDIEKDMEVGEEPDVPLEEEAQDMEEEATEMPPPSPVQDVPAPNTPPLVTPVRLSQGGAGLTGHDYGLPLPPGQTPLRHSVGPNGEPMEQKDPWELLDEHDASAKEGKVLTGKCFKKPRDTLLAGLHELPYPD
jgi:condensin-2 complex subunit H2